jgi:hypothetical protein
MKTIDEMLIKFKQPDLLKRKPKINIYPNHIKDDFITWGKSFIPRRVYGGKEITLVCDDNGNYKRWVKPEKKKKKEPDKDELKHGRIKRVRKNKGGHQKARRQSEGVERKGLNDGRRAGRAHVKRGDR